MVYSSCSANVVSKNVGIIPPEMMSLLNKMALLITQNNCSMMYHLCTESSPLHQSLTYLIVLCLIVQHMHPAKRKCHTAVLIFNFKCQRNSRRNETVRLYLLRNTTVGITRPSIITSTEGEKCPMPGAVHSAIRSSSYHSTIRLQQGH